MINLLGLAANAAAPNVNPEIEGFLIKAPNPSSSQVADFLKLYPAGPARTTMAQALVARGVSASAVSSALTYLDTSGKLTKSSVLGLLSVASAAFSGYHGMKRNHGSIGWGAWWFLMGGMFPIITPVISLGQGYAKAK